MSEKKKYEVGVQEVYTTWITVEAESVAEAKQLAENEIETGDYTGEFSHSLDSDTWTVVDDEGNYH